jgi:methyltransferase (TIGR00027 family)
MTDATEQAIQNVSDTAFLVAGFRALESERPQPLFRDPLAAKLAGERGKKILATVPKTFGVSPWLVAIRTVTIDDLITRAIGEGVDTVLNLGAGLDTRPYRMALPPGLRWVEVDYPHVIALKEECLAGEAPSCQLERTSLDLADHDARRTFLAKAASGGAKVLVLTEGVTPYLTEAEVAELADDLRRLDTVQYWINDYYSPESHRFAYKRRARFMRNAPLRFRPQDWFDFFAARGWQAREVRYIAEEGERLGRPIPLPPLLKLWVNFARLFASRERRDTMKRFVAYVLLIPK